MGSLKIPYFFQRNIFFSTKSTKAISQPINCEICSSN